MPLRVLKCPHAGGLPEPSDSPKAHYRSFGIRPETRNISIPDGHKAGLHTKFGPQTPKTFRVMTKTALGVPENVRI